MPYEGFMREALGLAKKGAGRTSPNPAVGALIVKGGRVVAKGFHKKAGGPHAEIEALRSCDDPKGATLYVTLEPCCHYGKTPPCVDAVISSGIKKCVIGMKDPNPLVSGRGIKKLKAAGIEVVSGVLEAECREINRPFIKQITTGLPFVTIKLALSLDGKIASSTGDSKWITGVEARKLVHGMRSLSDAIFVGSSTVVKDDPELTVRLVKGRNPRRVIADSSFRTPLSAKALKVIEGEPSPIVFTTSKAKAAKIKKAEKLGIEAITLKAGGSGVDLRAGLKELGRRGVLSVLVEGGGELAASFIKAGLADRIVLFYAPVIIGSEGLPSIGGLGIKKITEAYMLEGAAFKKAGKDFIIEGDIIKPSGK